MTDDGDSSYTYDADGNLAASTPDAGSTTGATVDYTYNDDDELITSTGLDDPTSGDPTTTDYSYDGEGNRTAQTPAVSVGNPVSYGYDAKSNLDSVSRSAFSGDPSANIPNQAAVNESFTYTGQGELDAYDNGSQTENLLYDPSDELLQDKVSDDSSGDATKNLNIVYGAAGPLQQVDTSASTSQVSYLHTDAQGSPRLLTSTVVAQAPDATQFLSVDPLFSQTSQAYSGLISALIYETGSQYFGGPRLGQTSNTWQRSTPLGQ